jgi:hypothetical protein
MIEIVGKEFENHWKENQPEQEYHADVTAIGSGRLKVILKSPATFHAMFGERKAEEPSEAMKFGTLVHRAILEPDKLWNSFVVEPAFTGFTKDGKESANSADAKLKRQAWRNSLPEGTTIVTQDDYDRLRGMMEALLRNRDAFNILKNGKTEISGYYRDPETGIKCRIRPDFLQFNLNALVDLKTTRDCSLNEFSKIIWNYRYDFQLAMYCEGIRQITGKAPDYPAIIAIEKTPPYEVAVYLADEAMLERGALDYRKALRLLKQCLDKNEWPGYQTSVQSISLPQWAFWEE